MVFLGKSVAVVFLGKATRSHEAGPSLLFCPRSAPGCILSRRRDGVVKAVADLDLVNEVLEDLHDIDVQMTDVERAARDQAAPGTSDPARDAAVALRLRIRQVPHGRS